MEDTVNIYNSVAPYRMKEEGMKKECTVDGYPALHRRKTYRMKRKNTVDKYQTGNESTCADLTDAPLIMIHGYNKDATMEMLDPVKLLIKYTFIYY